MTRKIQLTMSISLLFFVFVIPYIALVHAQDFTIIPTPITISPIPPEMTTKPPAYTIPPDLVQGYSAFSTRTPRIDGAITSGFDYQGQPVQGEWDDAVKIDFQLNLPQISIRQTESHNATLYIKNDYINLYMALVVRDEDYNAGDWVEFNFDKVNNNKKDPGDDQLFLDGPNNEFKDMHFKADGSSTKDIKQNGIGAAQFYSALDVARPIYTVLPITITAEPITASGKAAQDVLEPTRLFQGTWIFEAAHPLNSLDPNDINAKLGETIGINVVYWDDARAGGFPTVSDWGNMIEYTIAGLSVTGATADLSIHTVVLTQAIQNETGGLPLARRKTTIARVLLDIGTTGTIPANVFLYGMDGKSGKTLSGPIVASVNAPSSSIRTRTVITHSANFLIPNSWVDRDHLNLTAFVTSTTLETNFNNNWLFPAKQFTFHKTRVLNVYEVPINTGTAKNPVTVSKALITQNEQAMQRVFPVEKINFIRMDWRVMGGPWTGTFPQAINKLNEVVGQLVMAWLLAYAITGKMPTFPLPDLIYGYYTQNVVYGGLSDPTWAGGKGYAAVGYIATNEELTMAHESTHNLDRAANGAGTWGRHTGPTGSNCGAKVPDPNWPHVDDVINEVGLVASVWPPVLIPTDYPDYMSYCNSSDSNFADAATMAQYTNWISDYRWENLFEELEQSSLYPAPAAAKSASIATQEDEEEPVPAIQTLQISGWISKDGAGSLDSILQLEAPNLEFLAEILAEYPWLESFIGDLVRPSEPQTIEGAIQYEIVEIGLAGNYKRVNYFHGMILNAEDFEQEQIYFEQRIKRHKELEPGSFIELRVGDRVLDVQEVTWGVPEVHLLTPLGGEEWTSEEEVLVEWDAEDPDGGELSYTVQYSPDGGIFWIPLTTRRKEQFLSVDPSILPGSGVEGAYIRVLATDGFNTGQDMNDRPFFVLSKPPEVYIDSPVDGQEFGHGDLIPLKGHSFDLEDGELPDFALRWELVDSILGYGSSLEVARLGPGEHIIHLVGTDSAGNEGRAHIRVVIGLEEVVPPVQEEAIIRVGPDVLSFYADMDAPIYSPGDPAVLVMEVTNNGVDPALAVEVLMRLPPGLILLSDTDHVVWEAIEPGQTVGWEFVIVSEEGGIYEIGLELGAANRSPTVELVVLHVGEEIPETAPPDRPGLSVRAEVEPLNVPRGEPALLFVRIINNGPEPAYEVEALLNLPPGLLLVSESEPTIWEVIEPNKAVEWEFRIAGEKDGVYEISLEVSSANLPTAVIVVELGVGEEVPETTRPTETKPPEETSTPAARPPETSESSPIPGFETFPVLLAVPFLLWRRRRRR